MSAGLPRALSVLGRSIKIGPAAGRGNAQNPITPWVMGFWGLLFDFFAVVCLAEA